MSNLIALFPGSFKPPHKGHFDVIEKISNIEGISKVQVLISAPTKSLRSSLSASDARRIFEIYSRDGLFGCLVEFIESPMPSPISAVYDYIEKETFEPNTKIILVTSTKDAERFTEEKLNKYADKNPTKPSVSSRIFKAMQTGEGSDVSATAMRFVIDSDVSTKQKAELLISFMPSNLSEENQKDVLNILLPELFMESRGKKQMKQNNEEKILREYIRAVLKKKLNEAAIEDTPTKSTGINKLAGVLKIILPQIESSYKNLTTDKAQRDSFRKYLLKAYLDTLAPQDILADVPLTEALSTSYMDEQEVDPNDVEKEIEQSKAAAKKIDVDDPTGEKAAAEAEAEKEKQEKSRDKLKLAAEPEASKPFPTIAGLDPTGRDAAIEVYKKTADAIIRSYRTLHNQTDQKMFKDYLITNVLLWIDQYEAVISPDIGDVTTPEYEKQKADVARFNKGAEPAPAPAEAPEQAALSEQILKRLKQLNIV